MHISYTKMSIDMTCYEVSQEWYYEGFYIEKKNIHRNACSIDRIVSGGLFAGGYTK